MSRPYLTKIALVALAFFTSGWLTAALTNQGTAASPIWPPAGIALAALILWGRRLWWGIFWGDFLLLLALGAPAVLALSSAVGSTLAALVGYQLLRYSKFSPSLLRLPDGIALLLAALLSPMLNASIDITVQVLAGEVAKGEFWQQWWILWLGDCTGILTVAPFLLRLRLASRGLLQRKPRQRLWEGIICLGSLGAVSWLVFACRGLGLWGGWANAQYLEYLPFPFVVWAAIRFQTWGAILASLLLSLLAIGGTVQGVGPFIRQTSDFPQAILLLQSFIAIVTATALLLSAAVAERQRVERQLRLALERDRLLAEVALRIRQSLDLEEIFQATVEEIRRLLRAERAYIGYRQDSGQVTIVAESVVPGYPPLLGWLPEEKLMQEMQALFSRQDTLIADNVAQLEASPALREHYIRHQVRAALAVPLRVNRQPLGLLVVHQCSHPRHWQKGEVRLLEQLATQVAIAIQQARLYRQVQSLNSNLERQVEERTEQLQEKIREVQQLYDLKTVFLQAVSHDLRTSIMGLVMLLKNLENRPGDNIAISRSILERIINSSDRQLTLIDALSEDHFCPQRPLPLNCQRLSLWELADSLLADWQPSLRQSQATLTNLIPDNLPPAWADGSQLRRVFDHLLANALKHNPPGIHLQMEARVEGEMLRCLLTDDGVGMSPQQCQQLFKLYVRNLHNQRLTGIGLGSYQCRQIIESHGGEIGVESTPGQGTQFWFTLPVALPSIQAGCQ